MDYNELKKQFAEINKLIKDYNSSCEVKKKELQSLDDEIKNASSKVALKNGVPGLKEISYKCPFCKQQFRMVSRNKKFYCGACGHVWDYPNSDGYTTTYNNSMAAIKQDKDKIQSKLSEIKDKVVPSIVEVLRIYKKSFPNKTETKIISFNDSNAITYIIDNQSKVSSLLKNSESAFSFTDNDYSLLINFKEAIVYANNHFEDVVEGAYKYSSTRKSIVDEEKRQYEKNADDAANKAIALEKLKSDYNNKYAKFRDEIASKKDDIEDYLSEFEEMVYGFNNKSKEKSNKFKIGDSMMIEEKYGPNLSPVFGTIDTSDDYYHFDYPFSEYKYHINGFNPYKIDLMANHQGYSNNVLLFDLSKLNQENKEFAITSVLLRLLCSYPLNHKKFLFSIDSAVGSCLNKPSVRISNMTPVDGKSRDNLEVYLEKKHKIYIMGKNPSYDYKNLIDDLWSINNNKAISTGDNAVCYNASVPESSLANLLYAVHDTGEEEIDESAFIEFIKNPMYKQVGIFFIVFASGKNVDKFKKYSPYCLSVYVDDDNDICFKDQDNQCVLLLENYKRKNVYSYIEHVNEKLVKKFKNFYLKDLIQRNKTVSIDKKNGLVIPFGQEKDGVCNLELTFRGQGFPHLKVFGLSGSGKSNLLETILLSACSIYSPEELEVYIMDLKHGTNFEIYDKLKHVSKMSLESNDVDIDEMFVNIKKEELHRNKMFSELRNVVKNEGVDIKNIGDYNEQARKHNLPIMPLLLIIIDEYNKISEVEDAVNTLAYLIQEGRAYGIHIILASSQTISGSRGIEDKINQSILLNFDEAGAGSFGKDKLNSDEVDFISQVGHCIFRSKIDNQNHLVLIAFNNDTVASIDQINNLYPNSKGYKAKKLGVVELEEITPTYKPIDNPKETNMNNAVALLGDSKAIMQSKPVVLSVGVNMFDEERLYEIDAKNPLLLLLGERSEAVNFEYDLLTYFPYVYQNEYPSLYYINLFHGSEKYEDKLIHVLVKNLKDDNHLKFYKHNEITSLINDVYKIYKEREDNDDDPCNPIEIVIHYADELISALEESDGTTEFDISNMDSVGDIKSAYGSLSPMDKLTTLIKKGKDQRIYFAIHFVKTGELHTFKSQIARNEDFKDFIILPNNVNSKDDVSTVYIGEWFDALGKTHLSQFLRNKQYLIGTEKYYSFFVDDNHLSKVVLNRYEVDY